MLSELINKLLKIAERNNINYNYNLYCFNLENENGYKLSVVFMMGGKYSFIIEINGHIKYLDGLSDYFTSFLLSNLIDDLNNHSFADALKKMYRVYEKIQEIIKELKSDANSTN